MQFDPVTSEGSPLTPVREGLPKAFRMRHGRHYVEQLMGDTPLRTVREIPVILLAAAGPTNKPARLQPPGTPLGLKKYRLLTPGVRHSA